MKFIVREILKEDLDIIYKFMKNKEIAYLTDHDATLSFEDFHDRYALYFDGQAIDLKIFVIVLDDVVVGKLELGYDLENKTGLFEIIIGNKQLWGTGIAMKALNVLFAFGFNNLGLNKLSCEVYDHNKRSINFMNKLDMHLDGIMREDRLVNNKFVDVYLFSKLRNEFEGGI